MVFSQWLEKEGYWELTEKIPDLRDLKIIPEENLIITVSKDNTIRHIEYDSGKILKSGKPTGINEDNDYAKISSDGKTTVFGKFLENPIYKYKISISNNNDYSSVCSDTLSSNLYFSGYLGDGLPVSFKANCKFSDYDYKSQKFLCILNCNISYRSHSGQFYNYSYYGYKFNSEVVDGKFHNSDSSIYNNVVSYNKIGNLDTYNLAFVGKRISVTSGGKSPTSSWESSKLIGVNVVEEKFDELLIYNEYSSKIYNYYKVIDQVFEGIKPNQLLYLVGQELFTYDLKLKMNIDSVKKQYFKNICGMSHHSIFMHTFENNKYSMFSYPYNNEIFSQSFPDKSILLSPNIDEINGIITFCFSDGSICKLSPQNITLENENGFYLSKDSVYVNEPFDLLAISNGKKLKYQWEFFPGLIHEENLRYTSFSYSKGGNYDIKLTITDPLGKTYVYNKKNAITVMELPNAFFDYKILNDTLPLKVEFINKSKNATTYLWDFGDGTTSNNENPIHEYYYPGDFSPKLIVSNLLLFKDTITKYEAIQYQTKQPESQFPLINYVENTNSKYFRFVFLTNTGFSIGHKYLDVKYEGSIYFSNILVQIKNYGIKFNKLKTYDVSISNESGSQPSYSNFNGYLESLMSDKKTFVVIGNYYSYINTISYINIEIGESINQYDKLSFAHLFSSKKMYDYNDSSIVWIRVDNEYSYLSKSDYTVKYIWNTKLSDKKSIGQYSDTLNRNFYILDKNSQTNYMFFLVNYNGKIESEKSFSLDTNITLSGIKSVNENLILLFGSYKDAVNKTTYAYFGKYYPQSNILQDTILYSRKDIRKIERVNNSTYAAIGQSRGRQGYLLLDTNLHQIKDIRVENLTGEIKDMILHDNKVYLFTEKVVSNQTMALGVNESYQTTASVLSLPEDIIANVEDSPKIFVDKFTHSAYPNPASDVINLKVISVSNDICSIKLYDLLGVEIQTIYDGIIPAGTERNFSIQSNSLAPGAYYYVIRNGSSFGSGQINVMR
jgi:hypothetical protein